MKKYIASIEINNELNQIKFKTDENPIEFLWQQYGMDSYIESVKELGSELDDQEEKDSTE